ncbi:MAG: polyketide synthase dehydratase domain-containing protein, partial [Kiritimatiellae bacterium]|nr:polyketide synthase dehydratase domain-containing protein [Kiritimatiellia bacterium]
MNAEFYSHEVVLARTGDIDTILSFLERATDAPLKDTAYTCAKRAMRPEAAGEGLVAIVAASAAELRTRLRTVQGRIAAGAARVKDRQGTYYFRERPLAVQEGEERGRRLAFIFPGGASFYPDMLRDVTIRFPACRRTFDELSEALDAGGLFDPNSFIFPPAPYYRSDADVFAAGAYAEATASVYTANAALARLFREFGITPDAAAGYAAGEMNAFALAGMFGEFKRPERLKFLRELYKTVENAAKHCGLPNCVMVSCMAQKGELFAEAEKVFANEEAREKDRAMTLALAQTPRLRTYALRPERAEEVIGAMSAMGIRPMRLKLDKPFDTIWAKNVESPFKKFAGHWIAKPANIAVYSCRTAALVPEKPRHARDEAAQQFSHPVRLDATIRKMAEDGVKVFVEVGPRGVTAASTGEILKGTDCISLAANVANRSGIVQLQHVVAALAALGAPVDAMPFFEGRGCRMLDLENPLSLEIREDSQLHLSRAFPRLTLGEAADFAGISSEAAAGAGKAKVRAAAVAARERKRRQFEFGAFAPLVSDADTTAEQPGVFIEVQKTFTFGDVPFLADAAVGTNGISFSDASLRGLTFLPLAAAAETMAELAQRLVPRRHVAAVEELSCRKGLVFAKGRLALRIRAERIAVQDKGAAAVKVQIREDTPDSSWTWAAIEGTVILRTSHAAPAAFVREPLFKPRNVHWTDREIYPGRLASGELLQAITRADVWSEGGLDYVVEVPKLAGAVAHTRFPVWEVNPQLLTAVMDGFALWRSHERFKGAFSVGFRIRRLVLHTENFPEGAELNCYLRLTDVTPKSHICDIRVTEGNGNLLMEL